MTEEDLHDVSLLEERANCPILLLNRDDEEVQDHGIVISEVACSEQNEVIY